MKLQGVLEQVETLQARAFATADAAIAATVVFVDDVEPFYTESGSCTVNIDGVLYTATPDELALSLTLSPALSVAVEDGDPIALDPVSETKWAWVSFPGDDYGDPLRCKVPHYLVGYIALEDGPKVDAERVAVEVETEPEPQLVDVAHEPPQINATEVPIIVTSAAGESVRLDGDGLTAYTDDVFPKWVALGAFTFTAVDDGYVYAVDNSTGDIRKFDAATGDEITSGFPIAGSFGPLAVDDGYVYAVDAGTADIRKYDATTGVQNLSGFPIAGTFGRIAAAEGFVYAVDGSSDIAKYNATTGASVAGGFPIAGTFSNVAAAGDWVYATDSLTDIHKYAASNAAEDTTGNWAFTGIAVGGLLAANGDWVYTNESPSIYRLEVPDAGVDPNTEWPIITPGTNLNSIDTDGTWLACIQSGTLALGVYAVGDSRAATVNVESVDGSLELSRIRAYGTSEFRGPVEAPHLQIHITKGRRTATLSHTTSGTAQVVNAYNTFDGSGTNGDTDFWDYNAGVFTALVAGVYDLDAFVLWAANATGIRDARILVNGNELVGNRVNAASAGANRHTLHATVALVPGDTVSLQINQTSGAALNIDVGSFLAITRRGALAA